MIDFHTHILPCMDDGSQNISESLSMLRAEARQGIQGVVLTPHFYAHENSPAVFLKRRDHMYRQLKPYLGPELPEVILGAEVQYFEGICTVEEVRDLRIEGTDYLLVEMPFTRWSNHMIEDVIALNDCGGIRVVLAHIERYMAKQPKDIWSYLRNCGIMMQSNVSFFSDWKTRHKAMSMLSRREINFLGSDCHNMKLRQPNWDQLPEKAWTLAQKSAAYYDFQAAFYEA